MFSLRFQQVPIPALKIIYLTTPQKFGSTKDVIQIIVSEIQFCIIIDRAKKLLINEVIGFC